MKKMENLHYGTDISSEKKIKYENKRGEKEILSEEIDFERKEAKERFSDLIKMVSERYKNLPETMQGEYNEHNSEILDLAIELGIKNGFTKEELESLEVSAIFHDMAKADDPPEEFKDVPNYTLAMHAKKAADLVPDILTDEILEKHGISSDFELFRGEVSKAIMEHMGPRPGFMEAILGEFNEKMQEQGGKGVYYPDAEGKISEALLAADMKSLAGVKGRKKVLSIRANVPFFVKVDKALVERYGELGIDLTQGEAALLSGFNSAFQAKEMIKDESSRRWVNEAIEESKKIEYSFGENEEKVTWQSARKKYEQYKYKKAENEVFRKIREAA